MRPVEKGAGPVDVYARYQDAALDLIARIGDYCSYCERQIETNLAIEHMQPKSLEPALMTLWLNFLLACVNCNSVKGATPVILDDFYWPDLDNTMRAFEYQAGGLVVPHPSLSPAERARAGATIALLGLDRFPGNPEAEPSPADRRWKRRQEVWGLACRCRRHLAANNTSEVRELIVENAVARGMFSIWWTVFAGDDDMRRRLRQAFPGTASSCFNTNEELTPRPGGHL